MNHKTWIEVGAEFLCTVEIPEYNVTAVQNHRSSPLNRIIVCSTDSKENSCLLFILLLWPLFLSSN